MTIGRRFRHELDADGAAGAGSIVDDEWLLEDCMEMLRNDAGRRVHAAAGRNVDDHADRSLRIGLGISRSGETRESGGERKGSKAVHDRSC